MSSTYKILCLSHDPAIVVVDVGWVEPEFAVAAANNRATNAVLADDHATCDLLIGEYSHPLVEVCCPSHLNARGERVHSAPRWVDRNWLILLYRALTAQPDQMLSKATEAFVGRCWTWERLTRLAPHLGIETAPRSVDMGTAQGDPAGSAQSPRLD